MVALSLYPKPTHGFKSLICSCGSCDSCKKVVICNNIFIFTVKKKKKYVIKGELNCNTGNVNH